MVGYESESGHKGFHYPLRDSRVIIEGVTVKPIYTWLCSDKALIPCIVPRSVVVDYRLTNSIVWLYLGETNAQTTTSRPTTTC